MPWPNPSEFDPQPIDGEPLRFHVRSRSEPFPHLVDLGEYCGNGQCSCIDFEMRRKPLLERGAYPADWLECWHIRQAKRALVRLTIRRVVEAMKIRTKGAA